MAKRSSYRREDSGKIARVVGFLLSNTHFKRTPLNDDISKAFLKKYMESLDYSRMVFLQPDYEEFEAKYGTLLDNLTMRGDVTPAFEIHKRLLHPAQDGTQLAGGNNLGRHRFHRRGIVHPQPNQG